MSDVLLVRICTEKMREDEAGWLQRKESDSGFNDLSIYRPVAWRRVSSDVPGELGLAILQTGMAKVHRHETCLPSSGIGCPSARVLRPTHRRPSIADSGGSSSEGTERRDFLCLCLVACHELWEVDGPAHEMDRESTRAPL